MTRRTLAPVAALAAGVALLSLAGRVGAADNPASKSHANARLSAFSIEGDKTEHVFFTNHDGAIIELYTRLGDNRGWQWSNLTEKSGGPKAASGPDAYHWADTKTSHVVYRGTDDGIYEMYTRPEGTWAHNNLSEMTKAPKAAGEPAAYTEEGNKTQHVIFRTAEGDLCELYGKYGESSGWQKRDLTAASKAPKAAGSPDAFYWPGNKSQHVLYLDSRRFF
jgi:hypothetical protein